MTSVFTPRHAVTFNAVALLVTLLALIATPVSVSVFIALVLLYALAYLYHQRNSIKVDRLDGVVIVLLLSYTAGRIAPFYLDDFSSRYLAAPLHVAASIPIYLMLRHAGASLDLKRYREVLEWGASLGAIGGGLLATYQGLYLGMNRAEGFMFYLNFAYLACSLMLICLALLRNSQRPWLLLLGALGGLVAIVFSATRGVMLFIPLMLLATLLLNIDRIGWKRLIYACIAMLGLSLTSYATIPIVKERVDFTIEEFTHIKEGRLEAAISSGGRVQLWKAATEAFKTRPLVGLTYPEREAQIRELVNRGELTEWMLGIERGHAHSQYFEVLATGGIVGILMLTLYLGGPLVGFFWLHRRHPDNPFANAGLLFTVGFSIYCLTEVALQKESIAAWYGFMQVNLAILAIAWQQGHLQHRTY